MSTGAKKDASVEELRKGLRGPLLQPGDAGYDAARTIDNAMIDRRPALIARCAGVADVLAAVRFARQHKVLVSVRAGGHNVAGNAVCDGGLMIDLSAMKGIRSTPAPGRRGPRPASPGAIWTPRRRPSAWPRPAASSPPPGSPA